MRILSSEKTHRNGQRELKQLLTADIKQINVYEATRGAILGNHSHNYKEYFYITKGTFMVRIADNSFAANPGFIFRVDPNEKHTLEALTNKASFMTFLTEAYDPKQPDAYK